MLETRCARDKAQLTITNDKYDLARFVKAQESIFDEVCEELRRGEKKGHWMWFIFPQLGGLGSSEIAIKFAISSREEAQAYWKHPLLGARLNRCTELVNLVVGRSITQIFPYPDDRKFHSSMTLFVSAAPENLVFKEALRKYFVGISDPLTTERL